MKLFQKRCYKIIEDLEEKYFLTDKKVVYYQKLINLLVKKFSNHIVDYKKDEVFYWILNNVKSDIKKRDIFYLLSQILPYNTKRYDNLVKVYDYKLYGCNMDK